MDCAAVPIGELLPHGPQMTLIERLIEYTPRRSVAALTIRTGSRFFRGTGVPAWIGLEYMAQTIAAHAGFEARLRGDRPAVGLLLGTRDYRADVAEFSLGAELAVAVEPRAVEPHLASFDCSIRIETTVATAVVTIYRPAPNELPASSLSP